MGNAPIEPYSDEGFDATADGDLNTQLSPQLLPKAAPKPSKIDEDGEEDINLMEILFQFIPFYGRGDPSNDSTVRAALSSLSIEDIDSRDDYGNTLLLLACTYRCEDLARIMLNKGADPNAINSAGACCLHFACYGESSSLPIAKGLLQNGANPEVCESTYGCTPLHYCASNGNIEFCKLLLSHGAQINTHDYYNYTCADYAREAGMTEATVYLQQRLDKHNLQFQYRNAYSGSPTASSRGGGGGGGMNGGGGGGVGVGGGVFSGAHEWQAVMDPSSNSLYYVHNVTGETLWEYDWKLKMQQQQSTQQTQQQHTERPTTATASKKIQALTSSATAAVSASTSTSATTSKKSKSKASSSTSAAAAQQNTEAFLIAQTTKTRLIVFLGTHDPSRLSEVDTLLLLYAGKEPVLLRELCVRYKVKEDVEMKAFQAQLNELKLGSSNTNTNTNTNNTDNNNNNNINNSDTTVSSGSKPWSDLSISTLASSFTSSFSVNNNRYFTLLLLFFLFVLLLLLLLLVLLLLLLSLPHSLTLSRSLSLTLSFFLFLILVGLFGCFCFVQFLFVYFYNL